MLLPASKPSKFRHLILILNLSEQTVQIGWLLETAYDIDLSV